MRINPKVSGAWLPDEAAQAKRAKSRTARPADETAGGEGRFAAEVESAAPKPPKSEAAGAATPSRPDELFFAQAETFAEDVAARLKNASGGEVANTLRDLKLREAALRQALRTNEALVPSGLIEFLH